MATPASPVAVVERAAIVASTRARLEVCSRLDTPDGAVAMHLAALLEAGEYNAQGAASLSKAHAEAMERATRDAAVEGDELDELRERRAKRRGA